MGVERGEEKGWSRGELGGIRSLSDNILPFLLLYCLIRITKLGRQMHNGNICK